MSHRSTAKRRRELQRLSPRAAAKTSHAVATDATEHWKVDRAHSTSDISKFFAPSGVRIEIRSSVRQEKLPRTSTILLWGDPL